MTLATSHVYELWDVETGNLIADFAEESAALRAVREGMNDDGLTPWATVVLARVEPSGERMSIAQGSVLVARALEGPDGTINVGGLAVDASRVGTALLLLDALTNPAFFLAMRDLHAALSRSAKASLQDIDTVRSAVVNLSRATGVPVRVEADGPRLALVTPSEAMAGLLAVGVQHEPSASVVPVRAVKDGYAVDVAA